MTLGQYGRRNSADSRARIILRGTTGVGQRGDGANARHNGDVAGIRGALMYVPSHFRLDEAATRRFLAGSRTPPTW